jgi:hypothetical protein
LILVWPSTPFYNGVQQAIVPGSLPITIADMTVNPYQPPAAETATSAVADPLRLPAIGCVVSAVLGFALAAWILYIAFTFFELAEKYEDARALKEAWGDLYSACWTFALCILALFVAWSMSTRRNKWIVLLSSILGLIFCFPAPLAAIILLRRRRKEVWDSFGAGSRISNFESEI